VEYLVVFDIRDVDFMTPSYEATGLIVVLTAIVFFVVRRSLAGRAVIVSSYVILGLVSAWSAVVWISTYRDYRAASIALDDGRASVVEGRVSRFEPMPATGHASERFCVEDRCFYYSDFASTIGFHNTSSHGGPIKSDLPVRVTYLGDTIIKLEVAR
jgi:hypothetical protein